jgi:poly(A) polymerase
LAQLSRERVGAEITRLLAAPDPAPALAAMEAAGILPLVLPGAATGVIAPLVRAEVAAGLAPRWQRRLAALGSGSDWPARLRLSRAEAAALAAIARALAAGAPPAEAAYRFGAEAARDAALIAAARAGEDPPPGLAAEVARGAGAVMPVRAADLPMSGRALGVELRRLEALWIASDFRTDADALLAASQAR